MSICDNKSQSKITTNRIIYTKNNICVASCNDGMVALYAPVRGVQHGANDITELLAQVLQAAGPLTLCAAGLVVRKPFTPCRSCFTQYILSHSLAQRLIDAY